MFLPDMQGRNTIPTAACREQKPALWRREALIWKAWEGVMLERPVLGAMQTREVLNTNDQVLQLFQFQFSIEPVRCMQFWQVSVCYNILEYATKTSIAEH